MKETKERERVLKNIRNANLNSIPNAFKDINLEKEVYAEMVDEDLLVSFAEELTKIGGTFIFCENKAALQNNLKVLLAARPSTEIISAEPMIQKLLLEIGSEAKTDFTPEGDQHMIISSCEALVARLGSVVVSSQQKGGRAHSFYPKTHVVLAEMSQVVDTVKSAMETIHEKYGNLPSMISVITGPSRTADIEKTLVMGAHGPRELIVFVSEEL